MPAIVPPDEGSYSYAGTGYANPHTVTQITNGVSTSTYSYDLGDHVYYMLNREAGRLVDVDKVLSTRKEMRYTCIKMPLEVHCICKLRPQTKPHLFK